MKKSIVVASLCMLCLFKQVEAQVKFAAGVKAGTNLSSLGVENPTANIDVNFQAGFNAGIMALIKIGHFGIQPEVLFSRQGPSIDVDLGALAGGKATLSFIQDYVNVPLVLKYYPIGGLNIQFGPQFGFLVAAEAENSVSGQKEDAKDSFDDFDFGLAMGLGWDFPFGLTIDARYNMGLTSAIAGARQLNLSDGKNQVVQFSVGYQFIRLGKN